MLLHVGRVRQTDGVSASLCVTLWIEVRIMVFVSRLMIKYSDGGSASPSGTSKIALLKKVLHIITSVLHVDHEVRRAEFNAMPYHRILITLFIELTTPDGSNLEPIAWSIIEAFGQV